MFRRNCNSGGFSRLVKLAGFAGGGEAEKTHSIFGKKHFYDFLQGHGTVQSESAIAVLAQTLMSQNLHGSTRNL